MVITRVPAQRERLPRLGAGALKQVRVQLRGKKLVGQALVDQDALGIGCIALLAHQHTRIMCAPGAFILAQIPGEGVVAPRALGGCTNGRKSRDAAEHAGVP